MSQPLRTAMHPDEFLAWEARQDRKWEFDGFQPVAMVGVTGAHAILQANILSILAPQLRGSGCRVLGSDLKVQAGASYRYPDAFVTCTPILPEALMVTEPVVIFEIISKGTAQTDRVDKLRDYRAIPSLQRYVLIEQDRPLATTYARTAAGWVVDQLDAAGRLDLPEIAASIPMAELYDGVAFPTEA